MGRKTKQQIQEEKEKYESKIRQEELTQEIEGIKANPLYRERRRLGLEFDTGDPFKEIAYHLVRGNSRGNNIVMSTSAGIIFEANREQVRVKNKHGRIETLARFDPSHPNYHVSAPYFTRIAAHLSYHVEIALSKGESITIQTGVESPFRDVKHD